MKTVSIKCALCNIDVQKPAKEVKRRETLGKKMYCSRSCSGKGNHSHLDAYKTMNASAEHLIMMRARAKAAREQHAEAFSIDSEMNEHLRRSKKRRACDLTSSYLRTLWIKQDGKCALSGIPMQRVHEASNRMLMASLDRIDSSLPYVIGNVQFVLCGLNLAKRDNSDDDARAFIRAIRESS